MKSILRTIILSMLASPLLAGCQSAPPDIEVGKHKTSDGLSVASVAVQSKNLQKQIRIPAELIPYRDVSIYSKVQGFVKRITVDRGSAVSKGQLLIELDAPELIAQYLEAEERVEAVKSASLEMQSKIQRSEADQKEAEARLASEEAVQKRILHAAKTPGAIAETDIDEAQQKVAAGIARVQALAQSVEVARSQFKTEQAKVKVAQQALSSAKQMKEYLIISAPFDGVITERNVHEGSLVSSSSMSVKPMLRIQQTSMLRLLVPIPESAVSGMALGVPVSFTVPAFTGRVFRASISRIGHALDTKTRAMIVEADVKNPDGELEPGMYPEVQWQLERPYATLFVPTSAVSSNADQTFVIRIKNGVTHRVQVKVGQTMGDLVEVVSDDLGSGDEVVLRASDELKDGTSIVSRKTLGAAQSEHEE